MTDPASFPEGAFPSDDEIAALSKAYRSKRRRWARKIGRPYADDIERPEPGALSLQDDPEEG